MRGKCWGGLIEAAVGAGGLARRVRVGRIWWWGLHRAQPGVAVLRRQVRLAICEVSAGLCGLGWRTAKSGCATKAGFLAVLLTPF